MSARRYERKKFIDFLPTVFGFVHIKTMKEINYNLPIFLYTMGVLEFSKEKADKRLEDIKTQFNNANINIWYVQDGDSSRDNITCIWQPNKNTCECNCTTDHQFEF